jgi:septum formation protein
MAEREVHMTALVLASGSTTRRTMLTAAGVSFKAVPADVDEAGLAATMKGADPATLAGALAEAKARAVAARVGDAAGECLVLGADTVIALHGRTLHKCADIAGARALLAEMSGRDHHLVSAAVLVRGDTVVWRHASPVRLWVRSLSGAFLDAYLAAAGDAVLSSVGCYHYEGLGAQLFEKVEGDYFAVLGLPLLPLLAALRKEGVIAS